jgi:hypothetical protein
MWSHKRAVALWVALVVALVLLLAGTLARAQIAATNKMSDVRGTRHNFSAAYADGASTPAGGKVPVRVIKASTETQVCVFCHTPHEATPSIVAPLWNRTISTSTYIPYQSSSLDATVGQPGGSSKLCLSCHDGTMGVDKVNALNGAKNATIAMVTTGGVALASPVTMPNANTTGFTRNLGVNLSNDHPISFTYDSTLATKDGELRAPENSIVKTRVALTNTRPPMPLEGGQVQCTTCHDPHLNDKTTSNGNPKFLRMNRFQFKQPLGGAFVPSDDIICLACHDKGLSWAYSVHANKGVATPTYLAAAAQTRQFPSSLDSPANVNPPVWQVACLNCHDTHTVQGARRLLREGTSTALTGGVQNGLATTSTADFTKSAIENTCYQCHSGAAAIITPVTTVPDIMTDFTSSSYRMPVVTADQGIPGTTNSSEAHDIGTGGAAQAGANFIESQTNLGYNALANRHAECTDCHNPHRIVKAQNGLPGTLTATNTVDTVGTHSHLMSTTTGYTHSNLISGVLRGTFGVEPDYGTAAANASFNYMPDSTLYKVKSGDPKGSTANDVAQTYVTREYQICLKCHSNYGYKDDNLYPTSAAGNRPSLGGNFRTTTGTNAMPSTYTNQAKEFQAPTGHAGEPGTAPTNSGASSTYDGGNNHRSWHPVMAATGRSISVRNIKSGNPWLLPWSNTVSTGVSAVGSNTMYCTDCHGSNASTAGSVVPDAGKPWGPHGSSNPFLLKAPWTSSTGPANSTDLCFKCHNPAIYRSTSEQNTSSVAKSGFSGPKADNLHGLHGNRIKINGNPGPIKCNWCHVAVVHGWKNKAFLVNLLDLGPEAGFAGTGNVAPAGTYTKGPYYNNTVLRINNFARSGNWQDSDCGGKDYMRSTMCASLP